MNTLFKIIYYKSGNVAYQVGARPVLMPPNQRCYSGSGGDAG